MPSDTHLVASIHSGCCWQFCFCIFHICCCLCYCTVLEIVTSYGIVFQSRNAVGFGCVARSYPFIYFRKWNVSSTGEHLNSSSVSMFPVGDGERYMQVLLTVTDPVSCIRSGVYSCEFASGPTIFHNSVSAQIKCPIGKVL